jgi:uncharacterized protein (TIGR03083 family)
MTLPVPDRGLALAALRDMTARFTGLLRQATPEKAAIGYWSTADLAAHVSHVYGIYVDLLNDEPSPVIDQLRLSTAWDAMVSEDPERDLGALAERLEKTAARFLEAIENRDWHDEVNWHGGLRVPVYTLPAIMVNELAIHGRDIGVADGLPWDIPRSHGALAIEGLMTVMPAYLNRETAGDLNATFAFSLRGGPRAYFRVADGTLTISSEKPGPVDCTISADPVEYLLIGYGRKSQWIPALTGKVATWGRKPWLGLKFGKLFHTV